MDARPDASLLATVIPWLRLAARRLGMQPSDIDDLVNEVLLLLYSGRVRKRPKNAEEWKRLLHALLRWAVRAYVTDQARDREDLHAGADEIRFDKEDPNAAALQERWERHRLIRYVLSFLSEEHRVVISRCDLGGIDIEAFAQEQGISVPAAVARLHRARKAFDDKLLTLHREEGPFWGVLPFGLGDFDTIDCELLKATLEVGTQGAEREERSGPLAPSPSAAQPVPSAAFAPAPSGTRSWLSHTARSSMRPSVGLGLAVLAVVLGCGGDTSARDTSAAPMVAHAPVSAPDASAEEEIGGALVIPAATPVTVPSPSLPSKSPPPGPERSRSRSGWKAATLLMEARTAMQRGDYCRALDYILRDKRERPEATEHLTRTVMLSITLQSARNCPGRGAPRPTEQRAQ